MPPLRSINAQRPAVATATDASFLREVLHWRTDGKTIFSTDGIFPNPTLATNTDPQKTPKKMRINHPHLSIASPYV